MVDGVTLKVRRYTVFLPFMIAQIIGSGSTYFLHIFLARFLGVTGYGIVAIFWAALNIVAGALSYGIPQSVSRLAAVDPNKVDFRNAFTVQLIVALIGSMLAMSSWFFAFDSSMVIFGLFVGAIFAAGYGANTILLGVFNGKKQYSHQAFLYALVSVTRFALSIALILFGFGYAGVFIGISVSPLLSLVIGRYLLGSDLPWKRKDSFSIRAHSEYVLPVAVYGLAFSLIMNSPIMVLAITNTEASTVGLFQSAFTLATIGYALLSTVNNVVFPEISSRKKIGFDQSMNTLKASVRLVIALSVMVLPVVLLWPTEIIALVFTSAYADAGAFLLPLVLAMIAMTLLSIANTVLIAHNRSSQAAFLTCGLSAVTLIGELLISRHLGFGSISWSFLMFAVVGTIASIFLVIKAIRFQ